MSDTTQADVPEAGPPRSAGTADPLLPRETKGHRPQFFDDPAVDQIMTFFMGLMTEVMVLRDRQETLERTLDQKGVIERVDMRDSLPPPEFEAERAADNAAFIERVLRIHAPERWKVG